jgi:peptidoglycan/xylan/chitin deacetylase (PgdA/CDA1 family)
MSMVARTRRVVIAVAVLALLAGGTRALARSRTVQLFGTLVARADISAPLVALTFDDGPTRAVVGPLLRVLEEKDVKATFFVIGAELDAAPEAGRALVTAGHELGNHTWSHERMVFRSPGFIRDQLERTDARIRQAGHRGPIAFRPPYGYKLVALPWVLARSGRVTVTWDVEPDSSPEVAASPQRIAEHVAARVRPGSIVLLHVWYPARRASLDAVPLVVDAVRARGYRFVTVSQLVRLDA